MQATIATLLQPASTATTATAAVTATGSRANAAVFDRAPCLELFADDAAAIGEWLAAYLAVTAELLADVERSAAGGERAALAAHAHKLASASLAVGATHLGMLGRELETAAPHASPTELRRIVEAVIAASRAARAAITDAIAALGTSTAGLSIPIIPGPAVPAPGADGMSDLEGLRILVVDDEPFMRMTIKAVLRAIGRVVVAEADDGDTALNLVGEFKPNVVLCDITMPRMGGLQFVAHLRESPDPAARSTPVVIPFPVMPMKQWCSTRRDCISTVSSSSRSRRSDSLPTCRRSSPRVARSRRHDGGHWRPCRMPGPPAASRRRGPRAWSFGRGNQRPGDVRSPSIRQ